MLKCIIFNTIKHVTNISRVMTSHNLRKKNQSSFSKWLMINIIHCITWYQIGIPPHIDNTNSIKEKQTIIASILIDQNLVGITYAWILAEASWIALLLLLPLPSYYETFFTVVIKARLNAFSFQILLEIQPVNIHNTQHNMFIKWCRKKLKLETDFKTLLLDNTNNLDVIGKIISK